MAYANAHNFKFTGYQKFVVGVLAFLQFTVVLDFMVLSPLGAVLMPALSITPSQFGMVVSGYAFSAGISGFLAGAFADRFDRKKMLLVFYTGFILGTFLCGIARNFPFLLFARMVTGVFGGIMGSIVFAIATDLFPYEVRGRVIGTIQSAFASSQVLGIPVALFLSNHWGWHAPFFMIVAIGAAAGLLIFLKLQPIDAHLKIKSDRNPMQHLVKTLSTARYLKAFATMALLATGGFMLMPFASAFSVHNMGIPLTKLPVVYLAVGLVTMVSGPFIGRACDVWGKYSVFVFGSVLSMIMIYIYTNLGITPISIVIAVNALLMVGITSRIISSQALMSAIPTPESRGSFMSVNASMQMISGGLASMLAGLIVAEAPDGAILNFDLLGHVVLIAITLTLVFMHFLRRHIPTS